MSLESHSSGTIVNLILAAISGGGLAKALDWLASRGQSKAYTMGAVDHAVQTAMKLVTERLEIVEGQHTECQAHLQQVRSELDQARAQISRLLSGDRVAAYHLNAGKGDPGRGEGR